MDVYGCLYVHMYICVRVQFYMFFIIYNTNNTNIKLLYQNINKIENDRNTSIDLQAAEQN